jgi:ABC-2 type transport system ATP-binding protein
VDAESEPEAPQRRGPGGNSAAARPGAARRLGGPAATTSAAAPRPIKQAGSAAATSAKKPSPASAPAAGASPIRKSVIETPVLGSPPRSAPPARAAAAHPASRRPSAPAALTASEVALSVAGLSKTFGDTVAVEAVDLTVQAGSFFGFVGPNGAGKTTTLSMVTGLLRPDSGVVKIYGVDVWANPAVAKRSLGVLPDRLRLFDRLTGSEFLHHAGALRGLDRQTIGSRVDDLERAFGIEHSAERLVSDYSAGMIKKIGIAAAMIHSPRLLVLDEPFESVDPVSAQVVIDILKKFAVAGGTVVLSSHSMDLIERVCDAVAIIAEGRLLASGPMAEVLDGRSLEERFVELAGGATAVEGMEWLQSFSD